MKMLPLLFFLIISFCAAAQDKKIATPILMGIGFTPNYNYRCLQSDNADNNFAEQSRNDNERANFGYTAAVQLYIPLSDRFKLQTGLAYFNRGYTQKNIPLVYAINEPGAPTNAKFKYAFNYIGVPVIAKYSLGQGRTKFVLGAGANAQFLTGVKQRAIYTYADGSTEHKTTSSTNGVNKFDVSPVVSAGIDYRLTKTLYLLLEPTITKGLIATTNTPLKEKLWSAGVAVSLVFKLK